MVFWQLTINAVEPARLAAFWASALGYGPRPPDKPDTTWWEHYRARLGGRTGFADRIFDPEGRGPAIWFQATDEPKTAGNRIHLDLYPTGRDARLTLDERVAIVDARVAELVVLGASVVSRTRNDDPDDLVYWATLQDPEGNEFDVS